MKEAIAFTNTEITVIKIKEMLYVTHKFSFPVSAPTPSVTNIEKRN